VEAGAAARHDEPWFLMTNLTGNNDPGECSDQTVGRRMCDRIAEPPERQIDEVVRATLLSVGNWGGLRGTSD
jgi:hypothetical protein